MTPISLLIGTLSILLLVQVVYGYVTRSRNIHNTPLAVDRRFPYRAKIEELNFGQLIDERIQLRYLPKFLSQKACEAVLKQADGKFETSKVIQGTNGRGEDYSNRTSTTYYGFKGCSPLFAAIETQAAKLVGLTVKHVEGLQVVSYTENQCFRPHHDYYQSEFSNQIGNQRFCTIFVYLNDRPESGTGGETSFTTLGKSFVPHQGDALFWINCDDYESPNPLSLHAGEPPKGWHKHAMNIWIAFNPTY